MIDKKQPLVLFFDHSDKPFGRKYRAKRILALAKFLRINSRVYAVGPPDYGDMLKGEVERYISMDLLDVDLISKQIVEFSPTVAVFDMDKPPIWCLLLLRGIGSLIISIDTTFENDEYIDISINTCDPSKGGDFKGLGYWVPDLRWAQTSENVDAGSLLDEHKFDLALVINEYLINDADYIERFLENLRLMGISYCGVFLDDDKPGFKSDNIRIFEHDKAYSIIKSAGLIINFGINKLFGLMCSNTPLCFFANNKSELDYINSVLPEGGVFYIGELNQTEPEKVCSRIESILKDSEVANFHASLSSSIVSKDNIEKVSDIISVVKILNWDTEFFGFPVAFISCLKLNPDIVKYIYSFCEKNSIRLLEYLCDCHDRPSVLLAEKFGFNFADIRLTYEKFIEYNADLIPLPEGFSVCLATEKDINVLMQIAKGHYLSSRYFFDLNFPRDKVNIFYQDWVRKAVLGQFDDCAYVLKNDGNILGFCTIKFDKLSSAMVSLVGIDPEHTKKGYALMLLENTIEKLSEQGVRYINVITQGRNYGAQRLYQRAGFITKKTELWYHRWFLENEVFSI